MIIKDYCFENCNPVRSEIRKDYVQEKYVIIAPKRQSRPHDVGYEDHVSKKNLHRNCWLCPSQINKEPALARAGTQKKWKVYVVANKYPAVSLDNPNAYGTQEVVVETPSPLTPLEDLPASHIATLLAIYAVRLEAIQKNKRIQYVLIFKNNGGKAGASIQHAHSQIFATEFLPPHLFDKSQQVQRYKLRTGHCVYCDVIAKEKKSPRLILSNRYVTCFTPYASMHNYEAWILPNRHIDNISDITPKERVAWAQAIKHILKKVSKLGLPYNYYFHQVINDEDQHLYMKIAPRGSTWAGVEIGSGLIINPISPEDAAEYYRK